MIGIQAELAKWMLQNGGVFAATTLIFLGLYLYERYGRAKDRAAFDDALAKAQQEHVATLKLVTPLAQKFTDTMDVILPLAMAQINNRRRGE
ncbi:UNVERIFIED_ORG: hypothetical protein M2435_001242 [Rhizobium sophorae]|jgi:hypothetical protein|uniref:hypothetical protein n=1 Tax=Rhizobium leguminosarum TaxID=384 RepID=UPI0016200773|nr:hypothetical protein [Rhizobium leguminosarum]MBB4520462.1 hypothetical protein [Rhizobium leguminosarum]MDH6658343.1 hypothetical protein [Rhizobium sophorae]